MDGWEEWTRRGAHLVVTVATILGPGMASAPAEAGDAAATPARLHQNEDRAAVAQAIRGAARRLEDPRCQALLTSFTDGAGRSLRQALAAEGLAAAGSLDRIYFYDGSAADCGERRLAYTTPGSRVVFVCGDRFRTAWQQNPAYAEGAIIHEALHTLGLGENPPNWQQITDRVLDACRH
ncbi:MAG TPA: hypothetical protein VL691_14525 [Vicinamibacteria bacterium]|nr:hypothetical protein [Vicinamibacteria bacterium]